MAAGSARLTSRTTTVLVLVGAHGLVLWLMEREQVALPTEPEVFTSLLFWAPPAQPIRQRSVARPPVAAMRSLRPPSFPPAPEPDSGTAIAVPAPPGAQVDWSLALSDAAAAALEREKRSREQLGAVMGRRAVEDDPRNPHPGPRSAFRWSDSGIHRIDTRSFIPGFWLNDHCVLIAFIVPACKIGHIEIHGDLFEGAAAVHDEKLATPRPNDAP
jgi:hypothetical protein